MNAIEGYSFACWQILFKGHLEVVVSEVVEFVSTCGVLEEIGVDVQKIAAKKILGRYWEIKDTNSNVFIFGKKIALRGKILRIMFISVSYFLPRVDDRRYFFRINLYLYISLFIYIFIYVYLFYIHICMYIFVIVFFVNVFFCYSLLFSNDENRWIK